MQHRCHLVSHSVPFMNLFQNQIHQNTHLVGTVEAEGGKAKRSANSAAAAGVRPEAMGISMPWPGLAVAAWLRCCGGKLSAPARRLRSTAAPGVRARAAGCPGPAHRGVSWALTAVAPPGCGRQSPPSICSHPNAAAGASHPAAATGEVSAQCRGCRRHRPAHGLHR